MLAFFTNLSLMEFLVRYLTLFLLFSVIGSFGWFLMQNFHKNIQFMLVFLKGQSLVLQFSYYTLMTFLIMFFVILLYLMISTLNVIRHLICGNNLNWLLNLNLVYKTGAGSCLLILMLEKTPLVSFNRSSNTSAIDMKMDGSVF